MNLRKLLALANAADDYNAFLLENIKTIREIERYIPQPKTIICNFCGEEKEETDFYRHPVGRMKKCKQCISEYGKRKRQEKPQKRLMQDSYYGF